MSFLNAKTIIDTKNRCFVWCNLGTIPNESETYRNRVYAQTNNCNKSKIHEIIIYYPPMKP